MFVFLNETNIQAQDLRAKIGKQRKKSFLGLPTIWFHVKLKNTEILTLQRIPFVPYIWINFVETQFWNNISIKKASPRMSKQLIKALFKKSQIQLSIK
jgi:hypothetical protein